MKDETIKDGIEKAKENLNELLDKLFSDYDREQRRKAEQKQERQKAKQELQVKRSQSAAFIDYTNTRFTMFFEEIDFNRLDFLDSLSKAIYELKKEGIKPKFIANKLYNIFNEGIEKIRRQETDIVWDFMKSVSQRTMFNELEEESKYMWVLEEAGDVKHCSGCLEREGQVMTYAEWEVEGLPGSGVTDCDENCLCHLEEVK